MKRAIGILRNVIFVVCVLAICSVIFMTASGRHIKVGGYQVLRVLTSSMSPTIPENTCILVQEVDTNTLKVGDIITFQSDDPNLMGYYNTHRIHEFKVQDGEKMIVTKGDAADAVDAYPVHLNQVAGKYIREIPGGRILGKFFLALSDNRIYFLCVMLPLAFCLVSYFWDIVQLIRDRDDEDEDDDTDESEKKDE